MTEKEKLKEEIDQIIDEHNRRRKKRRRNWMLCGAAGLLLLVILLIVSVIGDSGEKAAGPYESIAGAYEIDDVEVLDMFDFPGFYYDMGDCTIQADGNIEFSCYDGEPEGDGAFETLQGTVKRCDYVTHDYEVSVPERKHYRVFLDKEGSRIVINVSFSYTGSGYTGASRKIDYYYK